jgi:nucleoside-diphosphate-sugar epimerase
MPSTDTYCVLGCNGFIGRHLVVYLQERGHPCTGVARNQLDLEDADAVTRYFETHAYDVVVHCAAVGGSRLRADDDATYAQNVAMFTNVAAHAGHWRRFVWLSSGAAVHAPSTPYGASKAHCERLASAIPNCQVWRVFGCYGEDEPEQRFMASCRRQGWVRIEHDRQFDFIWVRDLCTLIERCGVLDGRVRDAVYKTKVRLSYVAHHVCGLAKENINIVDFQDDGKRAADYIGHYSNDVGRWLGRADRIAGEGEET